MEALALDQIHLWTLHLGKPGERARENLFDLLSPQEKERATAFHFDHLKWRYIRRRGLGRRVLADYCGQPPEALVFEENAYGKPFLSEACNPLGLHVNWSVSGDLAVLACSRTGPVGVDVEEHRALDNPGALVADFFSSQEINAWQALPPKVHAKAFYVGWTRKEACVKALGTGLSAELDSFSVSFDPMQEDVTGKGWHNWSVRHFQPSPTHEGAVTLCHPNMKLAFFEMR